MNNNILTITLADGNEVSYNQHAHPVSEFKVLPHVGLVFSADDESIHIWRIADSKQLKMIDYKASLSRLCEVMLSNDSQWMILHYQRDTGNCAYDEFTPYYLSNAGVEKLSGFEYDGEVMEIGFNHLMGEAPRLLIQGFLNAGDPNSYLDEYELDREGKFVEFVAQYLSTDENEIEWGQNANTLYEFISL